MVCHRCAKQEPRICKARRVDGQRSHIPPPIPCKADLSMFITQTQAAMAAINPEGPRNPTALQVPLPCPRPQKPSASFRALQTYLFWVSSIVCPFLYGVFLNSTFLQCFLVFPASTQFTLKYFGVLSHTTLFSYHHFRSSVCRITTDYFLVKTTDPSASLSSVISFAGSFMETT